MANDRSKLARIISRNLEALLKAVGMTQAQLARCVGVVPATVSNYMNPMVKGEKEKIPTLEFMIAVCNVKEFKERGLDLTIDLLISENFNPRAIVEKNSNRASENVKSVDHGGFLGNYLCYFSEADKTYAGTHRLRYGVISVFDAYDGVMGDASIKARGLFFSEEEKNEAFALKTRLDILFREGSELNAPERNESIANAFKSGSNSIYEGEVRFSDDHVFINLVNSNYRDNALIILYSPEDGEEREYVGGLGCVNSITRDRIHAPILQKMIITKNKLGCSDETVAEYLDMHAVKISLESEARELCRFVSKLYSGNIGLDITEEDRLAMVDRRLDQLVRNYIKNNIYSVEVVDKNEDQAVYELISQYKD